MASDVIFNNPNAFDGFDSNVDIFMNDGVMDPKELYLTDLACSKDASSSDSGISTLDDLPDVANDTDLQSLIDGDFKDLDFNFEHMSKAETTVCNSDFILNYGVKTEPVSPQTSLVSDAGSDDICFANTLSPDFYTVCDDISLSNDSVPLVLPVNGQSPEQQPVYFQEIADHQLQQSPVFSPLCTDFIQASSSPSSPYSPTIASPTHILASPPHVNSQPLNLTKKTTVKSPPLNITVLPSPTSQSSILVLPNIKQEILTPPPIAQPTIAAVNLNTILNSNIKIKPKPGLDQVSLANTSQWLPSIASQVTLQSQTISVGNLVTSSPLITNNGIAPLADAKHFKRAQRIIKNRESASLSRKRKKEYMSSLEERLQACFDDNSRLMRENEVLKKQVHSLRQENLLLKVPNGSSPAKKVCLMCVGLLLVLNLSPFSFGSTPTSESNSGALNRPLHHAGRQLLSVPSSSASSEEGASRSLEWVDRESWSQLDEELSQVVNKLNISAAVANMCPMYFNSTESLRLAEQLTGWMIRQEEEKKKKDEKKRQKRKKVYPTLRRFGSSAFTNAGSEGAEAGRKFNGLVGHNFPVQVFSGPDPRQQMLNAIHRRNDTFYVLSFSTDYFLVPATAHNKTMRPRMSLLMPVFTPTLNEGTGQSEDSVAMMQIDCEIHKTNLIHVQRSALPKDATLNSTAQDHHFQRYGHKGENGSRSSEGSNTTSGGEERIRQGGKYWENLRQKKTLT